MFCVLEIINFLRMIKYEFSTTKSSHTHTYVTCSFLCQDSLKVVILFSSLYIIFLFITLGLTKQEQGSISGILAAVKAHAETIDGLREDHSLQSSSIEKKASDTFQKKYMVCPENTFLQVISSEWLKVFSYTILS